MLMSLFIHLFIVLRHIQHCSWHITTGSWEGRGNQSIELVKVLYCKLPTNSKQLPAFPLEDGLGSEPRSLWRDVDVIKMTSYTKMGEYNITENSTDIKSIILGKYQSAP